MKNITIILLMCFSVFQIFSQKICLLEDKALIDVNTLNKCAVEKKQKKQKIDDVIVSSKRYFKKRVYLEETAELASSLKEKTISDTKVVNDFKIDLVLDALESKEKEVSFDLVEEIPLFASCADSSMDKLKCFNAEIQKHINSTFEYPEKAIEQGIEGDITVSFIIDKKGEIKNIKASGDKYQKILNAEAKRIVSLLPVFKPGKQDGKELNVFYSFSMSFSLDEN
ncbi:energy transducer TonB [Tenacibaculum ovolyticum]|uniref:energy transducer TonB n=1 Tax=Tenacibaculum ovolyticum TaxID=104270 RepID=UPI003BA918E2